MGQLRTRAISGVKWTTTSTFVTTIIGFLRVAVLAHLLNPIDFGLMSMLMVVIGFSQSFVDMGIGNAIIHRQNATKEQLSSLYWLSIFSGVVIYIALIISAPLVVAFYREPRLTNLLSWVALSFLITPIGQQFQILLQKELRFRVLAKIDIIVSLIAMITAIITALLGQGVFSLVWSALSEASARSLILCIVGWADWKPSLHFNRHDLKNYLSFGLYQMGEKSVNYLSANVDYLFVGRFLGPTTLGVYTLAYQLVVTPFTRINPILTKVAFPVFSKKQADDSALKRGYLEIIQLLAYTVFPIMIGLAVVAPLFVPIVYGLGWNLAVPLIQILAIIGMLKTIGNVSGSIYLAKGRADIGFKWNLFTSTVNTVVFWFAAQRDVFAVAWSWAILSIPYFMCSRWLLYRVIKLEWKEYLLALFRPALFSIAMGFVIYFLYRLSSIFEIGQTLLLAALITIGSVIYCSALILFEFNYCKNIVTLLFKRGS